ncbi:hypothetical protein A2U01_0114742, partial [Trifolium medium]|nr:hypothetical protein [Trifolium medium]
MPVSLPPRDPDPITPHLMTNL